MQITYNSPVILTFALLCTGVTAANMSAVGGITESLFSVTPYMDWLNPISYFRLFSHIVGHAGWDHLFGNMTILLLLGPMIEEKYGSRTLLIMMLITAFVTGLLNIALFQTGLMGASGVVFMLILLSSLTNFKAGHLPLTFLLVVAIFLGNEVANALSNDQISQFAHVMGGICGSIFGFKHQKQAVFLNSDTDESNYENK